MAKLYKFPCSCGFEVQSHDKSEAARMGMEHVMQFHPREKMTPKDITNEVKKV